MGYDTHVNIQYDDDNHNYDNFADHCRPSN